MGRPPAGWLTVLPLGEPRFRTVVVISVALDCVSLDPKLRGHRDREGSRSREIYRNVSFESGRHKSSRPADHSFRLVDSPIPKRVLFTEAKGVIVQPDVIPPAVTRPDRAGMVYVSHRVGRTRLVIEALGNPLLETPAAEVGRWIEGSTPSHPVSRAH